MPRIFLSYSHESAEHTSAVVALAAQLRLAGIDAILDQYVQAPDMGWPRWMQEQIEGADYVLVVCTAAHPIRRAEIGSWAPVISKPFELAEFDAFLAAALNRSYGQRAG